MLGSGIVAPVDSPAAARARLIGTWCNRYQVDLNNGGTKNLRLQGDEAELFGKLPVTIGTITQPAREGSRPGIDTPNYDLPVIIPRTGMWLVSFRFRWGNTGAGITRFGLYVQRNKTEIAGHSFLNGVNNQSRPAYDSWTLLTFLCAGDELRVIVDIETNHVCTALSAGIGIAFLGQTGWGPSW